jgi:hypothetical protein
MPEHATELRQSPRGVWEKLQTELTYDGVKNATLERQHLTIRGYRTKQRVT